MTETFGPTAPPLDWREWLAVLEDSAFTSALAVARQGAREWQAELGDPTEIAAFAEQLLAVRDESPASERLIEGLPHLIS